MSAQDDRKEPSATDHVKWLGDEREDAKRAYEAGVAEGRRQMREEIKGNLEGAIDALNASEWRVHQLQSKTCA